MQNIFVEFLPPWIETGLQPAFYDKESGTVLQQVARMYAKVNYLVEMFNKFSKDTTDYVNDFADNTTETINEYIEKFTALKDYVDDYFENLDVQEEINNKLDDMVEQGTLQEIIAQYIQANVAWSFDTVADMKATTNFINGSYAQTFGFHTLNDGGGALYKIRTITNDDVVDEKFIIALYDNTLIAELIMLDGINVKQLGAYGDDTHDDTAVITSAIEHGAYKKVYFPSGTYVVTENFTLPEYCTICGCNENSILKYDGELTTEYLLVVPITSTQCVIKDIRLDGRMKINGIYDGKDRVGDAATTLRITNVRVHVCINGVYLNAMGSRLESSLIFGNSTNDNSGGCDTGIYINSTDNMITDTRVAGFSNYGIYNAKDGTRFTNVKSFLNGTGCYLKGVEISASLLEAQENFYDNFKMYQVHSSNFVLTSGGAGTEDRAGQPWPLPSTLNEYAHLNIDECDSTSITIACTSRVAYGTRNWSCEGYIIKMQNSLGMYINATSVTVNYTRNALPRLVSADNILGNTVIVNGTQWFNTLIKQSVTIGGTSNVTVNNQSDGLYDITIAAGASGGIGLFSIPYVNANNLAICNTCSESLTISNMSFRYTVSGTNYSVSLQPYLKTFKTSDMSVARVVCDFASALANNEQYQEFISQGATITGKIFIVTCEISTSSIVSRNHIKGHIEVYAD